MSVLNTPGAFDIQVYSIEKQRWVLLEKVSHFKNNQQIVTEIKNKEYNSFDPPIDNSDCIVESIVGIRIFVGNYDYETGIKKPIILETDNQGLMIHSLRAEVRDTKKCVPDEVKYLNINVDRMVDLTKKAIDDKLLLQDYPIIIYKYFIICCMKMNNENDDYCQMILFLIFIPWRGS